MINNNKIEALILARGGSKGIPRKNLLDFCGKPLVVWSVLQAINTPEIDNVYISSDSDEILNLCSKFGAIKIKRPDSISGDTAKSESAVTHFFETIGSNQKIVIMLEPTAPLRKKNDLSNCINSFKKNNWDSCFSGAILHDFLIWRKDNKENLNSINYDYKYQEPRQSREPDYVENGGIYMFTPNCFIQNQNRFGGNIGVYLTDFWQSFEIDEPQDWKFVSLLFKEYLTEEYKNY
tara:strand:- start:264 stop:968 length:705 start_codon:yes stop_codon:yes gene_type:complete